MSTARRASIRVVGFVASSAMLLARTGTPAPDGEAQSLARISSIPLATGFAVEDAHTMDVDGDGVADLVLAESGPGNVRRLLVHLRRKEGPAFVPTPDASLDLTPDVICYAVGDVHADAGREIVLFNASGAFAWRWRSKDEAQRFQKLVDCDLLWQWPERKDVFHFQDAIVDLDRDGLDDLLIPGPWKYQIAFQRKDEAGARRFERSIEIQPGAEADAKKRLDFARSAEVRQPGAKRRANVSVSAGGFQLDADREGPAPWAWIEESVPSAQVVDWLGAGRLDLAFLTPDTLHVFAQESSAKFAATSLRLQNPVPVDRTRELDVSYTARVLDLDGDKRADALFSAGDKRSDSVRTQVLVFLSTAIPKGETSIFGAAGVPTQVLVLDGFARPLGLEDVDGDGKLDLVAGAIRPDLIDGLRAAASERIEAELYVYKNTGRGFSKRPDLVQKVSVQASGLDVTARFLGDISGDGVPEFFERSDKDKLRAHLVRKSKDALSIVDRPLWEMQISEDAKLLLPGKLGPGSWDLFAIEKDGVRCASFR